MSQSANNNTASDGDTWGGYPRVSVVMPLYNAGSTVVEAMASVFRTGYPNLELVVVDDGSNDDGPAQVEGYKSSHPDHRIVFHRDPSVKNRGAGETRNVGATMATGKYLAFLDADDVYLPNRFQDAVGTLEAQPRLVAIFGLFRYELVGAGGRGAVRDVSLEEEIAPPAEPPSKESESLLSQLLRGVSGIHTSTVTMRREAFHRLGGFPSLKYVDDQALWLRLFAKEEVDRLTGPPVSVYRIHDQSWCSRGNDSPEFVFGPVLSRMDAVDWLRKHGAEETRVSLIADTILGRLLHRLTIACSKGPRYRQMMRRLMYRAARLSPKLLLERRYWSVLAHLVAPNSRRREATRAAT